MSIRVRWEGSFFANHSLALVNREIALPLSRMPGFAVSIASGEPTTRFDWDAERIAGLRALESAAPGAADVTVRHRFPPDLDPPRSGRWVIIQPWEFGSLPRAWQGAMRDGADEVWVHSTFNKQCYVDSGIPAEKIQVIAHGVQPALLGEPRPFPLQTRKRFKFLFVGGTIRRKGIDILLDSYVRAFNAADDVCLVIKDFGTETFYRNQTFGHFIRELQTTPGAPEIEYLTDELTPEALRDLYHACDCLVHPYRGEGFGLPILEAMACGLAVLVPDQGGASDFCTPETALLLPSRRVPLPPQAATGLDTVGSPWWLEVKPEELRARMREIYEEPAGIRAVAEEGRRVVRERYTWAAAAERVAERVRALAASDAAPARAATRRAPSAAARVWLEGGRVPFARGYDEARWEVILGTVDRAEPVAADGAGLDPRVVEYPWLFDRLRELHPAGEPALDAGSVMNHAPILHRWTDLRLGPLSVFTLKYEGHAHVSDSVRYEFGDLRELPYRDGWFSTVLSISTLEHVGMDNRVYGSEAGRDSDPRAEVQRVMAELARVTRPGGTLLVTVPFGAPQDLGWLRVVGLDEARAWLTAPGWEGGTLRVFRCLENGWAEVDAESAGDAGFNGVRRLPGQIQAPRWVAAAEAVALVEMRRAAVDAAAGVAARPAAHTAAPALPDVSALQERVAEAERRLQRGDPRRALEVLTPLAEELRDAGHPSVLQLRVNVLNLKTACHFFLRERRAAEHSAVAGYLLDPSNATAVRNLRHVAVEFAKLPN